MESFFDRGKSTLNPQQAEAVTHKNGPLLVLAGAGSGKTRVLTYRIAYLVQDCGFHLNEILAMTFSNKAAREMHARLKNLLGDESPYRYPWISTFHSVCVRLLRMYGKHIGLDPNFVIYDSNEQLDLIKDVFEDLGISEKAYSPKAVHAQISHWKNDAKFSRPVEGRVASFDDVCWAVYSAYQKKLRECQAVDFDDLLLETYRLLNEVPDIQRGLQNQWKHLLIDEFQDTNKIQYKLIEKILNPERNICVVGDDDQSIYGWRGARVENILNFDKEFQACKVIRLEQNYRSTANILKAASAVISKNEFRHQKTLWTEKGAGHRIRIATLEDDRKEAQYVVNQIRSYLLSGVPANEIAVLYRVNSVSRVFEEECLRQRVDYKIVGGFRFYERKEIKDVLAYLKLLMNPADILAFRRSVNQPARGIGNVSVEKLEAAALAAQMPIGYWLIENAQTPLSGKAKQGIQSYQDLLKWGYRFLQEEESLADLVFGILERSGYVEFLRAEKSEESREREENLQELLSAVQEFEEQWHLENQGLLAELENAKVLPKKLFDFLERIALISDADQLDEVTQNQITFMSLHAAKGLEFQICFMAAMEDGLFPSARSFNEVDGLEEERRLCYVGITRAKERLILTRAERRRSFGSINYQMPSRFLNDIPKEILEAYVDPALEYYQKPKTNFRSQNNKYKKSFEYDEFNQLPPDEFAWENESQVNSTDFSQGDRVHHPSFGDGIVRKIERLGNDECLVIDFSRKGRKRVLSQFVQKEGAEHLSAR